MEPIWITSNVQHNTFEEGLIQLELKYYGIVMSHDILLTFKHEVMNLLRYYKMDKNLIKTLTINGNSIDYYL